MTDNHMEVSESNNAKLKALETEVATLKRQINDLHRRFLEPAPTGEPPLADRLAKAVRAYEQASWLGKTGVWLVLTIGGLAGAGTAMFTFLQRIGK